MYHNFYVIERLASLKTEEVARRANHPANQAQLPSRRLGRRSWLLLGVGLFTSAGAIWLLA